MPCLGTAPASQCVEPQTNRAGLSLGTAGPHRSCQLLPLHTGHCWSRGAPCTARHVLARLQRQPALSCSPACPRAATTLCWVARTRAERALCHHGLRSRSWLRQGGSWQSLSKQSWALAHPQGNLPALAALPRSPTFDSISAEAANRRDRARGLQDLCASPEAGLCLLSPLHSPLGSSGSGTRFSLPGAAGDSGCLRTPPVPAEGTVALSRFQLLSSALAGGTRGEQAVDLLRVTC